MNGSRADSPACIVRQTVRADPRSNFAPRETPVIQSRKPTRLNTHALTHNIHIYTHLPVPLNAHIRDSALGGGGGWRSSRHQQNTPFMSSPGFDQRPVSDERPAGSDRYRCLSTWLALMSLTPLINPSGLHSVGNAEPSHTYSTDMPMRAANSIHIYTAMLNLQKS